MSSFDQSDPDRGVRVERAIEAAKRGDEATTLGILAGMSAAEREAYGPLITGFLPAEVVAFLPEPATSR